MFSFETAELVVLFVLGALIGSFANVVIYRLPRGENIAWPGSHCQSCSASISWYHNVPILAWFWLRGKCAKCGAKYSFRYPFVELLMAVLFLLAGYRLGPVTLEVFPWTLVEALIFITCALICSFIDLDHMILPDVFTLSGIVIGLIGSLLNPDRNFWDAVIGVLAGGGALWAVGYLYLALRNREGMGGGDVKLLAWIGAVLGWKAIPIVILLSSVLGSILGIAIAIRTKDGMNKPIPFGPYLAGAAILYILLGGNQWSDWYLSLHGL